MKEMSVRISIDRDAVSAFCRRHCIKRLALFGSVLRDDFSPDSDVDVLVEFQPGHVPATDPNPKSTPGHYRLSAICHPNAG